NAPAPLEPHGELAEYSGSVTSSLFHPVVYDCAGRGANHGWRAIRNADSRGLCFGQRTEWNPGAIAGDGEEHAIRSRKDSHRAMEDRRRDQAANAGNGRIDPTQSAVRSAGNDWSIKQLTGGSGSEFQALPQPRGSV